MGRTSFRRNTTRLVDDLGVVLAQIAELRRQEAALKEQLREQGDGAYEGDLFRATVTTATRQTFDAKAAREKLWAEGFYAFVKNHTQSSESTAVRVVAKTGKEKETQEAA